MKLRCFSGILGAEVEWEPISSYAGIFDGRGHTISGLKVTGTGQFMSDTNGMFGEITGGCVKNLRLENPVVTRTNNIAGFNVANNGAIAGKLSGGQIIGCTVSNATISKSTAGGIVGSTSMNSSGSDGTTITGCAVINSQITGGTVGGIVGSVEENTTIAGCCSVGSTVAGSTVNGGIVASVLDKNAAYLTANACYWDGGPQNGVGTNPNHQGVTKVDGTTTKWADAVKAMQKASGRQFEVDASGKPTGVG